MIVLTPSTLIAITVSAGTALVNASFADRDGASFSEGTQLTSATGAGVTVVASPAAGVRLVKNLFIRAGSAATITVTIGGQTMRTVAMAASQTMDMLADAGMVGAAMDVAVVHLALTETITGDKTFSGSMRSSSSSAGLGYSTGAGGTVTQATSKATGVTLSRLCGTITLNAANLAANTSVAFTWTNTAIAAADKIVIDHDSVGTLGAYRIIVTPAAGSATVTVYNATAGALAEAIVLRFAIIKAVTA